MVRTVYHIICILFLGCDIIIENFQSCVQGIQNLSKNTTVYTFVFVLVDVFLQRGFYLAVSKSLTAFESYFMKL